MTVIPLIEPVLRGPSVIIRQIVGQAPTTMQRHNVPVSVTEGDHAAHLLVGGSDGMSGFYRAKPVAARVRVRRAMRRLRVVVGKVLRLDGSHLGLICAVLFMSIFKFKFEFEFENFFRFIE